MLSNVISSETFPLSFMLVGATANGNPQLHVLISLLQHLTSVIFSRPEAEGLVWCLESILTD